VLTGGAYILSGSARADIVRQTDISSNSTPANTGCHNTQQTPPGRVIAVATPGTSNPIKPVIIIRT
jgi:hypothetical protein